jgi:hypothetical protein
VIRGIENGPGTWREFDEFSAKEQERIKKKIDQEVVIRLEQIINIKSHLEKKQ